jgi:hypothetical protein
MFDEWAIYKLTFSLENLPKERWVSLREKGTGQKCDKGKENQSRKYKI